MKRLLLLIVVFVLSLCGVASAGTIPIAGDTYVRSDQPNTNFEATSPNPLHVDGDPVRRTLLYFKNVPASGVTSAKLRLHVQFPTADTFDVRASTCQGWAVNTVTYGTAPTPGEVLATVQPVAGYQDITIPASKIVPSAEGGFCLQLTKTAVNWMTVSSQESANPPELVLDTAPPADTTPPETTITSGPDDGAQITDTTPTFEFSANEPSTFQCTLDSRVLFDCSSPYTLDPQGQGQHQFTVQATDAAGNVDPTPSGRLFTVVPPSTSPVSDCADAPLVNATPSNIGSILANNNRVRINAAPGSYSSLSKTGSSTACVVIKCTVSAKAGTFSSNPSGCIVNNQSTFQNVKNLTVEGFVIKETGDGSYGFQHYDQANVGSNTRFANNVFDDSTDHDISLKDRGAYAEVVNNWFLHCRRHCLEIGQNGNINPRPSTTDTVVFRGNIAASTINVVTQRYNKMLIVEDNQFRTVSGYAVTSRPYWASYPFPDSGSVCAGRSTFSYQLFVPGSAPCETGDSTGHTYVPLRTIVRNNSFSSGNRMVFEGRGVVNDTVLVQGNTGSSSCSRVGMASDTQSAHINEQTTAPPQLDPASDRSC